MVWNTPQLKYQIYKLIMKKIKKYNKVQNYELYWKKKNKVGLSNNKSTFKKQNRDTKKWK